MSTLPPNDERLFDLLVDGELAEAQRRELLARLDREPSGWRRCAMAFLEAQSWGREMRGLAREPAAAASPSAKITMPPTAWWQNVRHSGTILALAASLLMAFGIGFGVNRFSPSGQASPPIDLALQNSGEPSSMPTVGRAWPRSPSNVTLVLDGKNGTPGSRIQLPVVEGRTADPASLMNRPSAVPGDVLQALERLGTQVRQQRQLLPFQLEDGRQLLVPVDQLDVQPVNARNYQ